MMEEAEARITTSVDVSAFVDQKRDALATHASQIAESWFGKLPPEAYRTMFGNETFIRAHDTTGAPVPETELVVSYRTDDDPQGAQEIRQTWQAAVDSST